MRYDIDVKRSISCDTAVIGGGTAGVFAAIAAARCGADVVLVEKNSRLGGTVTASGVNYPGLFFAWGKQIIGGPCFEAIERVIALGGATMPEISYKPKYHYLEQILIDKLTYLKVINDMCAEAGVCVLTSTMLSYAREFDGGVKLLVTDKSGLMEISCKAAIDSSGDADLARMLDYPCLKSEKQQPATPYNRISGYDLSEIDLASLQAKWSVHPFSKNVDINKLLHFLRERRLNIHIDSLDADLSSGREQIERASVDDLYEYIRFLRTVKGFENIRIDALSDETGVRESNRIVGEKTVSAEDYIAGIDYPDSICYAFYPIDLHVDNRIEQVFLKDGAVPKIPYGALVPKGSKRLLCAGRMVSSDTYANSALRVQAPCMAMGQAAGAAAAIAAKQNCHVNDVDINELRSALLNINAIVP